MRGKVDWSSRSPGCEGLISPYNNQVSAWGQASSTFSWSIGSCLSREAWGNLLVQHTKVLRKGLVDYMNALAKSKVELKVYRKLSSLSQRCWMSVSRRATLWWGCRGGVALLECYGRMNMQRLSCPALSQVKVINQVNHIDLLFQWHALQ